MCCGAEPIWPDIDCATLESIKCALCAANPAHRSTWRPTHPFGTIRYYLMANPHQNYPSPFPTARSCSQSSVYHITPLHTGQASQQLPRYPSTAAMFEGPSRSRRLLRLFRGVLYLQGEDIIYWSNSTAAYFQQDRDSIRSEVQVVYLNMPTMYEELRV